jgi:hypothetical protein
MAVITPDLPELFEEAYERAGLEMRSGYDLKTARRSLNLITLEWQNRGLNLWTIESGTISLTSGTATYTFPTGTIDVLEMSLRTGSGTNQIDSNIQRISVSTYSQQTNKNTTGRPTQGFVRRLATSTTVTLWPVPDSADTYTLAHFYLRGMDSINSGITGNADVPPRFVPCLVSGLAYYIAMKRPEVADRVSALKQEYEFQFQLAAGEDQESASIRFIPFGTFYGGS